jgi:hypothetical protein
VASKVKPAKTLLEQGQEAEKQWAADIGGADENLKEFALHYNAAMKVTRRSIADFLLISRALPNLKCYPGEAIRILRKVTEDLERVGSLLMFGYVQARDQFVKLPKDLKSITLPALYSLSASVPKSTSDSSE